MLDHQAIVQIAPSVPPAINGLGDYGAILAENLYSNYGLRTTFLVTRTPSGNGAPYEVICLPRTDSRILEETVESLGASKIPSALLLHFVGYAYEKRGCPLWLLLGLRRLRVKYPRIKVVTMFHELYASGPPWRSSFWLSLAQKNIAKSIGQLSDEVVTSCPQAAAELKSWLPGKIVWEMAIPSNVGESANVAKLSQRDATLVVFGRCGSRQRAWDFIATLPRLISALQISDFWDIGAGDVSVASIGGATVTKCGTVTREQASALLSKARFGLLSYRCDRLARSGVFAAYSSHGLLPIVHPIATKHPVTLQPFKHFMPATQDSVLPNLETMQRIADSAHGWYQGHNCAVQAETFRRILS